MVRSKLNRKNKCAMEMSKESSQQFNVVTKIFLSYPAFYSHNDVLQVGICVDLIIMLSCIVSPFIAIDKAEKHFIKINAIFPLNRRAVTISAIGM